MSQAGPCRFLEWDSNFFGRRIARIEGDRLNEERIRQITEWGRQQRIECMYFLADPADAQTVEHAERWQAHFVDIRVTLRRDGAALPATGGHPVRPFEAKDVPELRHIARTSHTDGRFFFDSGFTRTQCESFYEEWIARSCDGFADAVLVAEINGAAAGYVTCHVESQAQSGRIGLFAVGESGRGIGVGKSLAAAGIAWFAERGIDRADVVTQGRNVASQRLYARAGFRTEAMNLWYHKWFDRA